ncbi:MAG: hypothetical protein IT521_02010 [Burkholderiales bacterium]|nr:hypothetical protein [Burkholderiales bacterium]
MAKKGMPTDSVEAAVAWRDQNLDPSLRKEIRQPDRADSVPAPRNWRERRDQVAVEKAVHGLAIERGEYVSREVVKATWSALVLNFRSRMLHLPRKLASELASASTPTECETIVEDAVHEALHELAGDGLPGEGRNA